MTIGADPYLVNAVVYLGASVVAVAAFKRLGLGSVLGYLAAGAIIGPSGAGVISGADDALHVGEFGVVMLLFVIGLELQPARLWRMRGEIFGLGLQQVCITGLGLAGILIVTGVAPEIGLLVGLSMALSSTAFGVQILRERGELAVPYGRRAFSILLFQDIAVVPLLALAAVLAPGTGEGDPWINAGLAVLATAALLVGGRFGLPWLFRLIALARADEVFTAAALLVVAVAALVMQSVGLSMALGAFLAGVLLSETEFRHQVETDIEPFRSLLLGLFFMAVGISVDWDLVINNIRLVIGAAVFLFAFKAALLYRLVRGAGSNVADSIRIAATLGQSGEFTFVLLAVATGSGLLTSGVGPLLTAVVGVSMALTPMAVKAADWLVARLDHRDSAHGLDTVRDSGPGQVIVAGFGRTGQIVARILRMRGYDLTLIDNSPRRIKIAESFGDKVFFGDGSRLDVLTIAGAATAKAIFLCINDREGARRAVSRLRERFPDRLILAMTYDRFSLLEMREAGADEVMREVYESSIALARRGLERLGDNADLDDLVEEFRRRDEEMLRLQVEFGVAEGVAKMREKYALDRAG
jgi:monovalent cation:proton antiporter-2 (CPA2) family protein